MCKIKIKHNNSSKKLSENYDKYSLSTNTIQIIIQYNINISAKKLLKNVKYTLSYKLHI